MSYMHRPGKCPFCRMQMMPRRHRRSQARYQPRGVTRQHIIPKRRGGTFKKENIKLCCEECNSTMALMDDCVGMLACMKALGRLWFRDGGNSGARLALARLRA